MNSLGRFSKKEMGSGAKKNSALPYRLCMQLACFWLMESVTRLKNSILFGISGQLINMVEMYFIRPEERYES
jgi:hypothetical protein